MKSTLDTASRVRQRRIALFWAALFLGMRPCLATAQETNAAGPRLFELQFVDSDGKPVPDVAVEIRGGLAGVAEPIKRGTLLTPSLAKTDAEGVLTFFGH